MAGMCTPTGADLAIGCAASLGTTLPGAATGDVGAVAASLEQPATTAMTAMTAMTASRAAATPASTRERARRRCRCGMR
jgi:hypothetical protein